MKRKKCIHKRKIETKDKSNKQKCTGKVNWTIEIRVIWNYIYSIKITSK